MVDPEFYLFNYAESSKTSDFLIINEDLLEIAPFGIRASSPALGAASPSRPDGAGHPVMSRHASDLIQASDARMREAESAAVMRQHGTEITAVRRWLE